ncbi:hypothetical protein [Marinomonas fungiae]|uniref:Uncharacterized protein n=1 Tax=Marinomonas fungiae TaxID=1137284 RepID=A0A0K6INR6_9GAMM|nr:hypothetical protein [Marinomonas fungiae]CUB04734.1 hypothetical protein Ga0061065_10835 [Marinomonas fungiae]
MCFIHLLQEVFPFLHLKGIYERKLQDAGKVFDDRYSYYFKLEEETVSDRLKEEHQRSQKIDDKTSKFTLGLSVCLTVLGVASTVVAKLLPAHELKPLVVIFLSICSLYMLAGGIVSLGAFKLMPTYGYGTLYEYRKANNGPSEIVKALIGQENMNLVKQVRNQVAYMCIRNGFVMLLFSLLLLSAIITHNAYLNMYPTKETTEAISNDKGLCVVIKCNKSLHFVPPLRGYTGLSLRCSASR